ncbi:MAG: hypothetical protein U0804_15160 [Gemmataceae bacterium]
MRRLLLALAACTVGPSADAGVIVVANFTPAEVTLTLTEPERDKQTVTLRPAQVAPIGLGGPAVLVVPATPQHLAYEVEPYNAFIILPDAQTGRRLEGVELPGMPLEQDTKRGAAPKRDPVRVPVTLLVDDADPRAEALWKDLLGKRLAAASAVFEAHCGIRFEPAGFAVWKSEPLASTVPELLADFQQKVKAPPAGIAIGWTSRKVEEKPREPAPFGGSRAAPSGHLLMREWVPRDEAERTEALVHHLGRAMGAVPVPDVGSVMREQLGNGLALHAEYKMRFDPLNALVLNVWADERRSGKLDKVDDLSPAGRARLKRVYGALLKAKPGEPAALAYLNEFDRDLAAVPKKDVPPDPVAPPKAELKRDAVARLVVTAVTAKARAVAVPGGPTGDALTVIYLRTAATAALAADIDGATADDRVGGFLLGLAVALDDTDTLRGDETTREQVAGVESTSSRDERREVLGNPTVRGRRDLCRRFAAGVASGELLPRQAAEAAAVSRTFQSLDGPRPAGVGLPPLAAELAGIEFTRLPREDLARLTQLASLPNTSTLIPEVTGLPDGLSAERFTARYGSATDARFQAALDDLRRRVRPAAKP